MANGRRGTAVGAAAPGPESPEQWGRDAVDDVVQAGTCLADPPVTAVPTQRTSLRMAPAELLSNREESWSRKLCGYSIVAELEVNEADRRQVCSVLGSIYSDWAGSQRAEGIFDRWPACTLVALTGIASRGYERGALWPQLWEELGYSGELSDQTVWGRGFRRALDILRLPTFENAPLANVGPILMHAGIPDYCLADFFRLLDERRCRDVDLNTESFFAWAKGRASRLSGLDKPASRFLTHGSEYAFDFVERSFDLLERLRTKSQNLDVIGLPPRVVRRAQSLAADGMFRARTAPSALSRGPSPGASRPHLVLEPFGRGLVVCLPPVKDAPAGFVSWTVTADGEPHIVESQAEWVGVAEAAPQTSFALLRPARTVAVSAHGLVPQTELRVIDSSLPMLVFGEDGHRRPDGMPLPPDVVWVAHPSDNELVADGDLRILTEGQLPLGWYGWRLRQVDLERVHILALKGIPETGRSVRGYTRPRINIAPPLPGITTPYGTPVIGSPPEIWLPGIPGVETTWAVEIRRCDGGARTFGSYTVDQPTSMTELWERLPRPLLGAFEITVRGALGRGVTRTVFMAESLDVRYLPSTRGFISAGLQASNAELIPAVGAQASPRVVDFGVGDRSRVIEYRAGEETEPLVVTPPHLEVMHERADQSASWFAGPLRMPSERFADDPGVLLVRIPGATSAPTLRVATNHRLLQQVLPSGRAQASSARFELARVADTVDEHQRVELALDLGNVTCVLANIRPRRLASGADWSGDAVRLTNAVAVEGLSAAIYPKWAPWRRPVVKSVGTDGTVAVPKELRNAGPLALELAIDDPWAPVSWPRWPGEEALWIAGAGHVVSQDDDETALSRFAAGLGDFPVEMADLRMCWQLMLRAPRIFTRPEAAGVIDRCAAALRLRPDDAITAVSELGLGPDVVVPALVESGLVAMAFTGTADAAARLWATSPVLGALMGDIHEEAVREAAEGQCGSAIEKLLETGIDPNAAVGRFGHEAMAMASMQPQQIDGLWHAAQVVPQSMLDPDTRALAARRLFDQRADQRVLRINGSCSVIVRTATSVLAGRRSLRAQIEARRGVNGADWLSLPAASSALAIVARLAARGDANCQRMAQRFRPQWVRLASAAPDLVTIDLVLAELLISYADMAS